MVCPVRPTSGTVCLPHGFAGYILAPFRAFQRESLPGLSSRYNKDANAQIENGNKAAGTRARKASLEIEKAMKEFRKVSLEESKK